jgi:hypothetical protein
MLRYLSLACFFLLSANASAQMFRYFGYQEFMLSRENGNLAPAPLFFQYGYWLPVWSDGFGQPTVSHSLVESKALSFTKPIQIDIRIDIPYQSRPYEIVGSDGLPGMPLPAIYDAGFTFRDLEEIKKLLLEE